MNVPSCARTLRLGGCILAFASLASLAAATGGNAPAGATDAAGSPRQDPRMEQVYRPQFHFSPRQGVSTEPIGMVFYGGEYHLCFGYAPQAKRDIHEDLVWGHAVSRDLVHWEELPVAISRDVDGPIFSGSAAVDWNNTGGFQTGPEKALVAVYTMGGTPDVFYRNTDIRLAFSNDRGRTWTKYAGNPILERMPDTDGDRDAKLLWDDARHRWVLVVYAFVRASERNAFCFYTSPDLKHWTFHGRVPDFHESVDFFPLPVDGDPKRTKWVLLGGDGNYEVGSFDGDVFHSESPRLPGDFGRTYRATQTFNDVPPEDGRRIQMVFLMGGTYPGMPFRNQMTFPCELTLRTCPEGIRLCKVPVREIARLHDRAFRIANMPLVPGANPLAAFSGELLDIRADIDLGAASEVRLVLRGVEVRYSSSERRLYCLDRYADLDPVHNHVRIRALVDRTSIEVFGNDGRVAISNAHLFDPQDRALALSATGGAARIASLEAFTLRSMWDAAPHG